MLKHTRTYTDPVTHTPCTHMLNQYLMFCQGLRLFLPAAKYKCMRYRGEITFEEFKYKWWKETEKCSSKGQESLSVVHSVRTKVKWETFWTYAVDWNKEAQTVRTGSTGWRLGYTTVRNDVNVCVCVQVIYLWACSLVPIKANETNCYVSIHGCFSSCCKFRGWSVHPKLFLLCVGVSDCVFFLLLRHPPSVSEHARVRGHNSWATPSFFDVVRYTDACTHTLM